MADIKLKVKNSWDEISLSEFLKLKDIEDSEINDLEKDIQKLSILAGVHKNYFNSYPASEIKKFSHALDFLEKEPTADLKDHYIINGIQYKFISQIKDLSAGQFIDIINLTKDRTHINENLHLLVACFLLPVRKKSFYEKITKGRKKVYEKYLETSSTIISENVYEHLSISDIMAMSVFFCNLLKGFVEATQVFLEKKTAIQLKSVLKTLEEDNEIMKNQRTKKEVEKIRERLTSTSFTDGLPL
jgi:hypothetical protein